MRNTVKAWLKLQQKEKAEELAKPNAADETPQSNTAQSVEDNIQEEKAVDESTIEPPVKEGDSEDAATGADLQASIEVLAFTCLVYSISNRVPGSRPRRC